jgi:hypothetical protein
MKITAEHITYEWNGITLALTQDPYVSHDRFFNECFHASAVDEDDNEYLIEWDIIEPDYAEIGDYTYACDWDKIKVRSL